ncbi:MAG: aldose epimerase [Opitutales bacterium]
METIFYQGMEIRRWDVGPSTFLAAPERGARLMNWHLNMGDGSVRDVIHWPENADASRVAKVRGGNPILFPFAGRSIRAGDLDKWLAPGGEVLPMPQHGFARNSNFKVSSIDAHGFTADLVPDHDARISYPFDYKFTVVYRFSELSLQVSLILENEMRSAIPWAAGHHFYFQLPWRQNLARADHHVRLPARKVFQYKEGGLLEKVESYAETTRFDDPTLVNRIHYELREPQAVFGLANDEEQISIAEIGGPEVGSRLTFVTWTEADDSPFYCVEPWMAPPNAPETKSVRYVPPAGRDEFTIEIKLL